MTVGSQVKQCFYSLKSVKENVQSLSLRSVDDNVKEDLDKAIETFDEVLNDLNKRVSVLEREEPQYKGF